MCVEAIARTLDEWAVAHADFVKAQEALIAWQIENSGSPPPAEMLEELAALKQRADLLLARADQLLERALRLPRGTAPQED